jgi:hypothetical protein
LASDVEAARLGVNTSEMTIGGSGQGLIAEPLSKIYDELITIRMSIGRFADTVTPEQLADLQGKLVAVGEAINDLEKLGSVIQADAVNLGANVNTVSTTSTSTGVKKVRKTRAKKPRQSRKRVAHRAKKTTLKK